MFKALKICVILVFLSSCSNYYPLYTTPEKYKVFFETLKINTDGNRISNDIKRELMTMLPPNKEVKYILSLETNSSTSSTVNNIDGKISGYEIQTDANIKIYKREDFDKLISNSRESVSAPYYLTSDQVLSTLANRNKAKDLNIKNLSSKIYNKLLLFVTEKK